MIHVTVKPRVLSYWIVGLHHLEIWKRNFDVSLYDLRLQWRESRTVEAERERMMTENGNVVAVGRGGVETKSERRGHDYAVDLYVAGPLQHWTTWYI